MKLLFDQNLSHKLTLALADLFPGSVHVRDHGLGEASDEAVWEFARRGGFVIASKDDDFHQRSFLYGAPPKVIWLRVGNCTTTQIVECLRSHVAEIQAFERDEHAAFLALA